MIKNLNCTSLNGTIRGVLRIPENVTDQMLVIIMSHGFNSNYHYFDYIANKLLDNGIVTYSFDFCGGGEYVSSDGSIHDSSVLTMVTDLNNVIECIKSLDYVDVDGVYLLGHSQGGLVSSLSAVEKEIRGLFLMAPAYNIPKEMNKLNAPKGGHLFSHFIGSMSRKYILDARKIKIYDDVKNCPHHVYIFHGKNDTLVPLTYSENALKHYKNAQLHVLEGQKHTFTIEGQNYLIEQITKIIKENG